MGKKSFLGVCDADLNEDGLVSWSESSLKKTKMIKDKALLI